MINWNSNNKFPKRLAVSGFIVYLAFLLACQLVD